MEVAAAGQKLHRLVCFTVPIEFYSTDYCTYFRAQGGHTDVLGVSGHMGPSEWMGVYGHLLSLTPPCLPLK